MAVQVGQNIKNAVSDHLSPVSVIRGILISYIVTIPTFIIFAFILTYTDFPERYISTAVLLTTIISVFVAGCSATRNLKSKGWLNGSIVGVLYILVLYTISSIVSMDFRLDKHMITVLIISIMIGSMGGIFGINFKRSSHSRLK